jgi:hypothetical protein
MEVTTIGLDPVKRFFQVHGIGPDGRTVVRKRLRRPDVLASFSGLAPCAGARRPVRRCTIGRANCGGGTARRARCRRLT